MLPPPLRETAVTTALPPVGGQNSLNGVHQMDGGGDSNISHMSLY